MCGTEHSLELNVSGWIPEEIHYGLVNGRKKSVSINGELIEIVSDIMQNRAVL
jgi:hypothetical protein